MKYQLEVVNFRLNKALKLNQQTGEQSAKLDKKIGSLKEELLSNPDVLE